MRNARKHVAIAALVVALASGLVCPAGAWGYFTLPEPTISLAASTSVESGGSQQLSCAVDPASERQLPGCGMAECPQACDGLETPSGVLGGCMNTDGWCTCAGTMYSTVSTSVSVSSSNPSVALGTWSSGVLVVNGYRPGTATITVSASLAKHLNGQAQVVVEVTEAPASSSDAPSSADSGAANSDSGGSASTGDSGSSGSGSGGSGSSGASSGASGVGSTAGSSSGEAREGEGATGVVVAESAGTQEKPTVSVTGSGDALAATELEEADDGETDGAVSRQSGAHAASDERGDVDATEIDVHPSSGAPFLVGTGVVCAGGVAAAGFLAFRRRSRALADAAEFASSLDEMSASADALAAVEADAEGEL